MRERDLQIACADFLRLAEKQAARRGISVLWWHTPNEGKRSARNGADLKRQGLRPGVADLVILWRVEGSLNPMIGLAVELKPPRARTTYAQDQFLLEFEEIGGHTRVCRSVDELKDFLVELGLWKGTP